jgi:hypothetical protein
MGRNVVLELGCVIGAPLTGVKCAYVQRGVIVNDIVARYIGAADTISFFRNISDLDVYLSQIVLPAQ